MAEAVTGRVYGCGNITSKINKYKASATYPELRINNTVDDRACPIAALEYAGFSQNKIISLVSKEDDVYENTASFYTVETLIRNANDNCFPLKHYSYVTNASNLANKDYLITDLTTVDQSNTPLFYQYELMYDAHITEDASALSVYKSNETLISKKDYVIQYSYDLISESGRYTATTWGPRDTSEVVHRVRLLLPIDLSSPEFYTVEYNKLLYGGISNQRELIELETIYDNTDFNVTSSGVLISASSNLSTTTQVLHIVKDPTKRLVTVGIEPPVYQYDDINSWYLRLNAGSFYTASGEMSGSEELFYLLGNPYNPNPVPITNVRPASISDDIIKVDQTPIFVEDSKYIYASGYLIETYDSVSTTLTDPSGKIGIEVNGMGVPELKIVSIDRPRGYIQLNKTLNPTDIIVLNFYADQTRHVVVNNLELNPKITSSTSDFHISGYLDGLGVALLALSPTSATIDINDPLLFLYDVTEPIETRICHSIPPIGSGSTTCAWISGNFATVCELSLNRLSKDIVKITDARRVGGGAKDKDLLNKAVVNLSGFDQHEVEWYSDTGYYGGLPFSIGNSIIINIPSGTIGAVRNRWIEALEDQLDDSLEATDRGTREFNFYLDQVIKRYISAGTNYVLIPVDSSGNLMDIMTLDY